MEDLNETDSNETGFEFESSSLLYQNGSRQSNITEAAVAAAAAAAANTSKLPSTVKCSLLIILMVINFAGNGLTIEVIRTTRCLRTKTNFLVCSMTVSDMLVGMCEVLYITWNMAVYVFDGAPCVFKSMLVFAPPIQHMAVYAASAHVSLLAIDR